MAALQQRKVLAEWVAADVAASEAGDARSPGGSAVGAPLPWYAWLSGILPSSCCRGRGWRVLLVDCQPSSCCWADAAALLLLLDVAASALGLSLKHASAAAHPPPLPCRLTSSVKKPGWWWDKPDTRQLLHAVHALGWVARKGRQQSELLHAALTDKR